MASMLSRIERLSLITSLLPMEGARVAGLTLAMLKQKLADQPGFALPADRTLQRDLAELIKDGAVGVLFGNGSIPRYVRRCDDGEMGSEILDEESWEYLLLQVKQELSGLVSANQLERLSKWLGLPQEVALGETKLRILPDSLRLQPAHIDYRVLGGVLRALKSGQAIRVIYQDREGKRSEPVLHPQALLQRGPRIYLYAMKNDELADRMYAIDRMVSVQLIQQPAREMIGFDLDQRVRDGRADFSDGQIIVFEARVRGYLEQLLYDCPLNDSQQLTPLDGGGSYLQVHIPSSGQLLRWILAGGGNITVLAPGVLREIVVNQIRLMSEVYSGSRVTAEL